MGDYLARDFGSPHSIQDIPQTFQLVRATNFTVRFGDPGRPLHQGRHMASASSGGQKAMTISTWGENMASKNWAISGIRRRSTLDFRDNRSGEW